MRRESVFRLDFLVRLGRPYAINAVRAQNKLPMSKYLDRGGSLHLIECWLTQAMAQAMAYALTVCMGSRSDKAE